MQHITWLSKWAGAAVLFLAPGLVSADVITNGGFETGDFSGWSVSQDAGINCGAAQHSGNCSAYFGTSTLTQNLTTTAGHSYTLDFWIVPKDDDVSLQWNNSVIYTYTIGQTNTPNYQHVTLTGLSAAGSSTPLEFDFVEVIENPAQLDDVSVTDVTSTPEPGTIFLPAGGLLLLAGVKRRGRTC